MLRPPRRSTRPLIGSFVAIVALSLLWPASIGAAGRAVVDGSGGSIDRPAERTPVIGSRGVKDPRAGGHGPGPDLDPLASARSRRPTIIESAPSGQRSVLAPAPAPTLATSSGAPAAVSLGGGWEGLDQADTGFEPPDPWVAVGPNDVVQTVNTMIRFRNREGVATAPDLELFDFFDLGSFAVEGTPVSIDGLADPRWLYDARHGRWLGLTLAWDCEDAASDGYLFVAVSTSADPTGDYYHLFVKYPGFLPDYPAMGTSATKVTFSANEFVLGQGAGCTDDLTYDGASLTTFDWSELLASPASPAFHYWLDTVDAGLQLFSLRPAVSQLGSDPTIYVVGERATSSTTSDVVYIRIAGSVAGDDIEVFSPINLSTAGYAAPFEEPPTPIDPGGPVESGGIPAVDRRPTDAIWQDNVLTMASTYPCDPPGGAAQVRACARVTQIQTSPTIGPVQDMLIGVDGLDVWYPGIGQSQTGALHVVYSRSGASQGIRSMHQYQVAGGPIHQLSAAVTLAFDSTNTAYAGGRWGDYAGVAQDPKDTNAVWQGNQYTKADGTWGTRVSEIQTAGAVFVPIEPVRLLDSRVGNGTSGAFVSNVAKTIDIAGRGGIPANAVAVTGNLTVVNQTAAGFAAITPIATNNPSTSSLNFPLGDIRANNVTTPLGGPGGGVGLVYKAVSSRSAHFIFDVTGYFLDGNAGQTYNVLTPTRVLDSRLAKGLGGALTANVNYSFQVAGAFGVPADAKAVTGNLTVTGQTRAGYVSLSSAPPPATPATSTLNFPLNDNRANGITVKLATNGRLHVVYKAVSPASTHLVFDVTGYYRDDLNGLRFVPLVAGRRLDTRFAAPAEGLTGPFAANTARTLVISPYEGVAANAKAITGNLTVVGQSRAGFLAITPTATNTPPTSSLNFPFGDIRANGVTGPLSFPAGSVGIVYETSNNTGSTHVILDLTGYFR